MNFINNISKYSFWAMTLGVVISYVSAFSPRFFLSGYSWPLVVTALIGSIVGLIRHNSKSETKYSIISVIIFLCFMLSILILAGARFHD